MDPHTVVRSLILPQRTRPLFLPAGHAVLQRRGGAGGRRHAGDRAEDPGRRGLSGEGVGGARRDPAGGGAAAAAGAGAGPGQPSGARTGERDGSAAARRVLRRVPGSDAWQAPALPVCHAAAQRPVRDPGARGVRVRRPLRSRAPRHRSHPL